MSYGRAARCRKPIIPPRLDENIVLRRLPIAVVAAVLSHPVDGVSPKECIVDLVLSRPSSPNRIKPVPCTSATRPIIAFFFSHRDNRGTGIRESEFIVVSYSLTAAKVDYPVSL